MLRLDIFQLRRVRRFKLGRLAFVFFAQFVKIVFVLLRYVVDLRLPVVVKLGNFFRVRLQQRLHLFAVAVVKFRQLALMLGAKFRHIVYVLAFQPRDFRVKLVRLLRKRGYFAVQVFYFAVEPIDLVERVGQFLMYALEHAQLLFEQQHIFLGTFARLDYPAAKFAQFVKVFLLGNRLAPHFLLVVSRFEHVFNAHAVLIRQERGQRVSLGKLVRYKLGKPHLLFDRFDGVPVFVIRRNIFVKRDSALKVFVHFKDVGLGYGRF